MPEDAVTLDVEALGRLLFPAREAAAGVAMVDLAAGDLLERFARPGKRGTPQALRRLEVLFGTPPPPSREEIEAVASLRRALEAKGEALAAAAPAEGIASADLARLERARVGLLRIVATGASPEEIALRDAALRRAVESAGPQGHVIVLNFPHRGAGTAFLAGPRIVEGRIFARHRSLAFVAAVLARLAGGGGGDGKQGASTQHAQEVLELFR